MNNMKLFCIILLVSITSQEAVGSAIRGESTSHLIPCKKDWFLFGEKCYKVQGESKPLSWEKASAQCSEGGGKLAAIYSKEMRDFLFTFLLLNSASDAWIGLNDRDREGRYVWDYASFPNYTDWEENQPAGWRNSEEDCVLMRYWTDKSDIGKWNDVDCNSEVEYLCEQTKNETYQNHDPRFCSVKKGGGWKYLNSCYHIVTQKKTWDEAEQYCQEKFYGHLATVLDFTTEYFLNYILSNYSQSFWYGIKIREEAQQQWSSGWEVIFNRWEENIPLAEGTCAMRSSEYTWERAHCSQKSAFVCETSSEKPPIEENWPCPGSSNDWKRANGKLCYLFEMDKHRTWFDANSDCMAKGGGLVNTHSKKEFNDLYVQLRMLENPGNVIIGLHRKVSNYDEFEWSDGRQLSFHNWASGQPSRGHEGCVSLDVEAMRWHDRYSTNEYPYICTAAKDSKNRIAKELTQNLIPCKEDWYLYGEKCYKVKGKAQRLSWKDASTECSKEGGNIATIYSKEMQDFLYTFLLLDASTEVWIGLNDRAVEGKYVWEDDSVLNYTDWSQGEPDVPSSPYADCVQLFAGAGRWDDYYCSGERPYICQLTKDERYQNPDPRFCSARTGGGWKYLNSCFHIVTEKKTWEGAERYCQEKFNGHLATVLDIKTEYFLNYILSNYSHPLWYGIKIREEVQQRWSSGWQVIFNRWEENAPFAKGTCSLRSSEYTWERACCSLKNSFVCETQLNSAIATSI